MISIDDIAAQVAINCRISDAGSWGYYSVCGLLLRLRELFKWTRGLEPWAKVDKDEVLSWIGEREAEWEDLEGAGLERLRIGGRDIDPFDTGAVNDRISPLGYYYGAGRGMARKPLFVLGELAGRRSVEGIEVITLGRELVRDLAPAPAMSRDGTVIARREAVRWYLWERLEEAAARRGTNLAALALRQDGEDLSALLADPAAGARYIEKLVDRETENAVRHELGEIREDERLGGRWGRALSRSCGARAELLARGLKDVLADTGGGGRMEHIIRERSSASLGLYAAFDDGLRRRLFPGLADVFLRLLEEGDWGRVDEARRSAHRRLGAFVEPLLAVIEGDLTAGEAAGRAEALEEEMIG